MGRPAKEITEERLKALMRLNPSMKDVAAFFECHTDTIARYIRDNFDMTFTEFREENMVHTRMDLVQTALREAKSGNTAMLVFCLKNLCGWADKVDHTVANQKPIQFNYSLDETEEKDVTPNVSDDSDSK